MTKLFIQTSLLSLFIFQLACGTSTGPIGTAQEECNTNCEIKGALNCQYEQLSETECISSCEAFVNFEYTQACLDAEAAYYNCINALDYECGNFGALPPMSDINKCQDEMAATTEHCAS